MGYSPITYVRVMSTTFGILCSRNLGIFPGEVLAGVGLYYRYFV